jgi:regulator of nucleoside diphosphate kinase
MSRRSVIRKPKITLSVTDSDRLAALAAAIARRDPVMAENLLGEVSRARVVSDDRLPDDLVNMGSAVTYQVGEAAARTVMVVYPADADIDAGRISVLTPIGTALLGLSPGQTMPWLTTSGDIRHLLVIAVRQAAPIPESAGETHVLQVST